MRVILSGWQDVTNRHCDECGESPDGSWQMAFVKSKWICLRCLSNKFVSVQSVIMPVIDD